MGLLSRSLSLSCADSSCARVLDYLVTMVAFANRTLLFGFIRSRSMPFCHCLRTTTNSMSASISHDRGKRNDADRFAGRPLLPMGQNERQFQLRAHPCALGCLLYLSSAKRLRKQTQVAYPMTCNIADALHFLAGFSSSSSQSDSCVVWVAGSTSIVVVVVDAARTRCICLSRVPADEMN